MNFNIDTFLEKPKTINDLSTDFCGSPRTYLEVDGSVKVETYRCKKWRECQNCYNIRKSNFKERLEKVAEETENNVSVFLLDNDASKKLLRKRKITSETYIRTPYNNDTVIVVISNDVLDDDFDDYLQKVNFTNEDGEVNDELVTIFTEIPQGKRTSGNLGRAIVPEKKQIYDSPFDESDEIIIDTIELVGKASEEILANLFVQAIVETSTDVYTTLPIEDAYRDRVNAFEKLLNQNNITYQFLRKQTHSVSKKWLKENFIFLNIDNVNINSNVDNIIASSKRSKVFVDALIAFVSKKATKIKI